jgi:hypothetical protein
MPDRRLPPIPDGPLSRRQLFPTVIGGAAILAAAISLGRSEVAQAQSKATKTAAKYQDHPNGGNSCAICNYFRPPHACELVAGNISSNGWCSFFLKKT